MRWKTEPVKCFAKGDEIGRGSTSPTWITTRRIISPTSTVDLQAYDAVILANVSRGSGGLSEEQQAALTSYVHDTGGGLVDIGGPNAFGAGGWEGSKLEQILPVNMDVPAQRQIPKGALVLVMDPCEIPEGTYWGLQCGIQAVSALSSEDEIGIISWTWGGNQGAQYKWDLPLQKKGDGQAAVAALKRMDPGDMPEFDEPLKLALAGTNGNNGLLASTAQQKHIIIISDGDPGGVSQGTYDAYKNTKISVSTVEAFAHDTNDPNVTPVMKEVADRLARPRLWSAESEPQPASEDLHQGSDGRSANADPGKGRRDSAGDP